MFFERVFIAVLVYASVLYTIVTDVYVPDPYSAISVETAADQWKMVICAHVPGAGKTTAKVRVQDARNTSDKKYLSLRWDPKFPTDVMCGTYVSTLEDGHYHQLDIKPTTFKGPATVIYTCTSPPYNGKGLDKTCQQVDRWNGNFRVAVVAARPKDIPIRLVRLTK